MHMTFELILGGSVAAFLMLYLAAALVAPKRVWREEPDELDGLGRSL